MTTHLNLENPLTVASGVVPLVAAAKPPSHEFVVPAELHMLQARLGIVSSLFLALRAKHVPTAAHSLRVAFACSAWGIASRLAPEILETLEIAALLHDIGKISSPDRILHKADRLTSEEHAIMNLHPQVGGEILKAAGASEEVQEAVLHLGIWFNGNNSSDARTVSPPLAARMISIVDAFDSMTSDQIYRPASGRERAFAELFQHAGKQFDPELVRSFVEAMTTPSRELDAAVSMRWLRAFQPSDVERNFSLNQAFQLAPSPASQSLSATFHSRMLDHMHDGVLFIDLENRILEWNRAAERLTGHPKSTIGHKQWTPELLGLQDEQGRSLIPEICPLLESLRTRTQAFLRLRISHRDGRCIQVDAHLVPVVDESEILCGSAMLFRDATARINDQQLMENLQQRATQDPLTKLANRAELDGQLPRFVDQHLQARQSGSMIICDIDHFKRVNDTFGHQAGDDALICFAAVLRRMSRETDLVARYGGEEFVILCPGSDIGLASEKAESIRRELRKTPIPALRSANITASFGVTEIQPGDTDDSFLARADRALLTAKECGRDRVIQLGGGAAEQSRLKPTGGGWLSWLGLSPGDAIVNCELVTPVPKDLAIEKLKGFISDHRAEIVPTEDGQSEISLKIDCRNGPIQQPGNDRPATFFMQVGMREVALQRGKSKENIEHRTLIQMMIRPAKQRDRRKKGLVEQAQRLRASFQCYLFANEVDNDTRTRIVSTD